jgi:hypothetical protein
LSGNGRFGNFVGLRTTRIRGVRWQRFTDGQGMLVTPTAREAAMTDPRNKMHAKRVQQEKKHLHKEDNPGAAQKVQPGKKPKMIEEQLPVQPEPQADADEEKTPQSPS